MSLIREIHRQPAHVRAVLWGLSVFIAISFIGYFWLTSMERTMFAAIHDDPEEQAGFLAAQDERAPKPFALVGDAFGSLAADIGSLIGIDGSKGFDRAQAEDKVYLLPLSK